MSVSAGLGTTANKLKSGNIFAVVGVPFDLLNAFGEAELAKLSSDYQKKWEQYKKEHALKMEEIDNTTKRIQRTFILRLLYDELEYKAVKQKVLVEIQKAETELKKVNGSANVMQAIKELSGLGKQSNINIGIASVLAISVVVFIVILINQK
jgi:hypothetical protein